MIPYLYTAVISAFALGITLTLTVAYAEVARRAEVYQGELTSTVMVWLFGIASTCLVITTLALVAHGP